MSAHTKTVERRPITFSIDRTSLAAFGPRDLRHLADAVRAMHEISGAYGCQPRFMAENHRWTDAGSAVEGMTESLASVLEAVLKAAEACVATTPSEVEDRAWTILSLKAAWGDGLADLSVIAAEAVRDLGDATFNAEHEARQARRAAS